VLGRLSGPGPDCYLDEDRSDSDGVIIDSNEIGNPEEEEGREQCTEPLLKGHATDCNKYVICEFGLLREQSCPSTLHFNKVKNSSTHISTNKNIFKVIISQNSKLEVIVCEKLDIILVNESLYINQFF